MQQNIKISRRELAAYIDHTCLLPKATETDISSVCDDAVRYEFKSVCVDRKWLSLVVSKLQGSGVLPITVVAFPIGNSRTEEKQREVLEALERGAKEIDMVINRELLKERNYAAVLEDIRSVVNVAKGIPVKVILETSELSNYQKIAACVLAQLAGASFVKTSTGFSKTGATEEDVCLMRAVVSPHVGVKASGGIRSYSDALRMISAGANRLGTSASVAILEGVEADRGTY